MKKNLFILMLGTIIALTSCQKDNSFSRIGKEVTVDISAAMPNATFTKASESGGIVNWVNGTKLRYTLQVFDGDNVVSTIGNGTGRVVLYRATKEPVDFTGIRLLSGKTYNFVVWADFVNEDGTELHYTTVDGLTNISQIGTRAGNTESRDAYFGVKEITVNAGSSETMILKRPFGKMRVITTDLKDIHVPFNENTAVKVKYNSVLPTAFNALSGQTVGTDATPAEYTATLSEIDRVAGTATLSFDYIFADKNPVQTGVNFEVSCLGSSYKFESNFINIERNKLTTVKGNILTKATDINVTIEDEFPVKVDIVTTPSQMQDILNAAPATPGSAEIKLTTPLVENTTLVVLDATMSLNTPSILLNLSEGIAAGKTLTIQEQTVGTTDYDGTVHITVPASSEASVVVNLPAATVYVNGVLKSVTASTAENTLVVEKNASVETLRITKGNIDNKGTIKDIVIAVGNGNKTIINNAGSITGSVTVESGSYVLTANASTVEELRAALINPNLTGVILTADIAWTAPNVEVTEEVFAIGTVTNSAVKSGFVLDGNGKTISGAARNNVLAVYANNVTIKNLTIEQTASQVAAKKNNAITAYRVSGLTLENVTLQNAGKGGMIINGSQVTAKGLHTSGNAWGGVNVSKGTDESVTWEKPVFTFDANSTFAEPIQIWVDRVIDNHTVNAPSGWDSGYIVENGALLYIYSSRPFNKATFADANERAVYASAANTGKYVVVGNKIFTDGVKTYSTIPDALKASLSGDVIKIAEGSYGLATNFNEYVSSAITINAGITLEGCGVGTILKMQLKPQSNVTIKNMTLQQVKGSSDWADNQGLTYAPIHFVSLITSNLVVDGVTFNTDSRATSSPKGATAMYISKSVTVKNCVFNNFWKGIFAGSDTYTVEHNTFNNINPISLTHNAGTVVSNNTFNRNSNSDVQMMDLLSASVFTLNTNIISGAVNSYSGVTAEYVAFINNVRANNTWSGNQSGEKRLRIGYTGKSGYITSDMTVK